MIRRQTAGGSTVTYLFKEHLATHAEVLSHPTPVRGRRVRARLERKHQHLLDLILGSNGQGQVTPQQYIHRLLYECISLKRDS